MCNDSLDQYIKRRQLCHNMTWISHAVHPSSLNPRFLAHFFLLFIVLIDRETTIDTRQHRPTDLMPGSSPGSITKRSGRRATYPSRTILCPFNRLILGVLIITTASPTSAGSARLPCRASNDFHRSDSSSPPLPSGEFVTDWPRFVGRKPGEMALTRMLWGRPSRAAWKLVSERDNKREKGCCKERLGQCTALVMPGTACLLVVYALVIAPAWIELTEAALTIEPRCATLPSSLIVSRASVYAETYE